MSKITKLMKHPKLFFKDMLLNLKKSKESKIAVNTKINDIKVIRKNIEKKEESKKFILDKNIKRDEHNFVELERYTHLLHTGETVSGLSHLDLWIPVFQKADIRFIVFIRNYELFHIIKEKYPDLSIIYAQGQKDVSFYLDRLVFLKATFHPSNTGRNLHILMYNKLTHIFIGHGDSDKTASAHKYFRVYDENWVAGEAHIDRFRNEGFDFRGLKQVRVGRANLKETLLLSQQAWQDRFDNRLNLLYLSTWEGVYEEQNYTSVYFIEQFFKEISKKDIFNLINIKLHPWVGKRDLNLLETNQKLDKTLSSGMVEYYLHDKTVPVEDLIKQSNIFICDISAVISESLAADAPIFVYIPKDKNIKLTKSKMDYEDYCYTFSNLTELTTKIDEVVVNRNDFLATKRKEAMEYILGREETLNDEFINRLREI